MANNMANVWTQMNYIPPRGQCNHKTSVLSPKCPCLRFMLHPLKLSSSYECDGCAHHASFHSMENKTEDEIRKRWEQEARDKAELEEAAGPSRPKKRVRAIEYSNASGGLFDDNEESTMVGAGAGAGQHQTVTRGRGGARTARGGRRAKADGQEDGRMEIVEVD